MKYYGSPYKGCVGQYDLTELQEFDNPYDALAHANKEWDNDPDPDLHSRRLLVVVTDDYISNEKGMAFFQFKDFNSCKEFIVRREQIIWSNMAEQKWIGNGNMM